jgi:endonuclease/exonuclease/phosphatase family metal-dependent hydrolase
MKAHLNSKGFSHHFILPILVIIAVAGIGFLTLKLSNAASTDPKKTNFTVATYNIRAARLNKSSWDDKRANAILGFIKTVDIVGIQEMQRLLVNVKDKDQIKSSDNSEAWLTNSLLAAGYSRTTPTVSPRYGSTKADNGEDRAIFWRSSKFTLIDQGNETLVDHRNLPWVRLKENTSGKEFYFVNTHLTYGGSTVKYSSTRGKQIKQILSYVKANMTNTPVIFVGDMNSRTGSKEDKAIRKAGFSDAYRVASQKESMKYTTTLANFKGGLTGTIDKKSGNHIDHIYVMNGVSVTRVEVVGQKGSDHLPVEADVAI